MRKNLVSQTLLLAGFGLFAAVSYAGDFPSGYSKCADQGGTCTVKNAPNLVAYGIKNKWVYKYVSSSTVACTTATFGSDPYPGVNKKCSYNTNAQLTATTTATTTPIPTSKATATPTPKAATATAAPTATKTATTTPTATKAATATPTATKIATVTPTATKTATATPTSTTASGSGAPQTSSVGYGNAITGGGSATEIQAATMAAVQAAVDASTGNGTVIRYTGTFDFSTITNYCGQWSKTPQGVEIKDKSNITIIGATGSAANFGLWLKGASKNIAIRNMTIGLLPGGGSDGDIMRLEGTVSNVWIDHNEFFTRNIYCAGTPGDDTAYDGMLDIKKGATNITVSYNYLHDHHKVGLDGSSDSDLTTRRITFHHNYYKNVGARLPLQRGGFTHIFNNYYDGITTSGINVRMGGESLIEGNYFENAVNPVTSRDSSAVGYWDLRNNNIASTADFTKYNISWTTGSSVKKNASDWVTTKTFSDTLPYGYTVDSYTCVHDKLPSVAGAGKALATLKCN